MNTLSANRNTMQELLAKLREQNHPLVMTPISEEKQTIQAEDKYGNLITYNSKQQEFIDLVLSGASCVLIGAAGTGKTTCMRGAMSALIQSGAAGILDAEDHKHLLSKTPGIIITAYTRRATSNIRLNVNEDLKGNCITIHKLLEYQPVYYDITDPGTGDTKSKMQFEATRHPGRPLPTSINIMACEESSMLGVDLYKEQRDALSHPVQWIFLGDIQQLPPVFGPAILGFKLLSLPVIELTEVYRQALDSPIISLAHRILSGIPIPLEEFPQWKKPGLNIRPWTKKISADTALATISLMFCGNKHREPDSTKHVMGLHEAGKYDPENDMILIPFNKAFGTDELNKHIAFYLSRVRNTEVYEVIAGFEKEYFSVGDKVLYDKEDAVILKIESNPAYSSIKPAPASKTMDYWGYDSSASKRRHQSEEDENVDFMLASVAAAGGSEDRVRQCSHIITLEMRDSEQVITLSKASEINTLMLGYALTVHKSQGSEWDRVFFITHQSHATMLQRELLYTAVTRAKKELIMICEPETLTKGIISQRVKGNTIEEKALHFKGKIADGYIVDGE